MTNLVIRVASSCSESNTELGNSFTVEFELCSSLFMFVQTVGSASKSDTTGVNSPKRSSSVKIFILDSKSYL